jgi:hypothetical protein
MYKQKRANNKILDLFIYEKKIRKFSYFVSEKPVISNIFSRLTWNKTKSFPFHKFAWVHDTEKAYLYLFWPSSNYADKGGFP